MRDYRKTAPRPEGVRDPKSHRTPEQIRAMDAGYNKRHTHDRVLRNQARAKVAKRYGKAAIAGKDVDHIKKVYKGGGNSMGNLRIRSEHANRGDTR